MASMTFMPYVDKENAGSHGIHSSKGQQRSSSGLGAGKVFGSSSQNQLVTPRKALGDVSNRNLSLNSNSKGLKPQKPEFKQPAPQQQKGQKLKGNKPKTITQLSVMVKVAPTLMNDIVHNMLFNIFVDFLVQIEHGILIFVCIFSDDDFEDIWPKSERISTYISQLISWRPPCLFSHLPDSGDETDEEEDRKKRMEKMDNMLQNMPEPPSSICDLQELDDDGLWEPEPEISVPFPSDLELLEVSLPLDDSVEILQNVGQLKIHDTP
ncbi:uncharacterized protein [Argopecten irradians]|uniref:uncharacterized protein n=1 Tax=Argopecten irradians TaxID=31199 RepID=UPI00371E3677